jgi:hypothetical protein
MSTFIARVNAFAKYGGACVERFVRDHEELFLSLDERQVFESVASASRLNEDLPVPQSEQDAYFLIARILVELFEQNRIRLVHPLTTLGTGEYQRLMEFVRKGGSTEPQDLYAEAIQLYKRDVNAFNDRRAADPDFLERSNAANAAGLLR